MNKPATARQLGDLLRPALADVLKAQGFATGQLLRRWPDIVGERLAEVAIPIRVVWPPRRKSGDFDGPAAPATLVLRVEGAFALEAEMSAAQILERVNAVFGWRCIGKLRIRQGPVRPSRHPRSGPSPLDPQNERALAARLGMVQDEALRLSLERLGRAVLSRDAARRA